MKPAKSLHVTNLFMCVFLFVSILNSSCFGDPTIRVIPFPDGAERVEAIHVLNDNPSEIVFTTQNKGAFCGGGTPETAWKITVDPVTGRVLSTHSSTLSLIQNTHQTLYESSSGVLFTGGGWCGYKPPYYSVDHGNTWQPADEGTPPPNSTFSITEYKGAIYAGTGYSPYPGEVYRRIDGSFWGWQKVFQVPDQVRNIVRSMIEYDNRLFIGTIIYSFGDVTGTTPVYVSDDGVNFDATTGIPSSMNINQLFKADNQLFGVTQSYGTNDYSIYRWNGADWQYHTAYNFDERMFVYNQLIAISEENIWYTVGRASGDTEAGFYRSADLGNTWYQFDTLAKYGIKNPSDITAMSFCDHILYIAPTYIPEPATICLLGLGYLGLMGKRRFR